MLKIVKGVTLLGAVLTWTLVLSSLVGPKTLFADFAYCTSNSGHCHCSAGNTTCGCSGGGTSCSAGCLSGGYVECHDPE